MRAFPAYALALAAAPAMACEPPLYDPLFRDKPISVAPDCSFTEAGEYPGQFIGASQAQDIGNGLVGQVVTTSQECASMQALLVASCTDGTSMIIDAPVGNPPVSRGGPFDRDIKDLYAPRGKLRLYKDGSLAQLQAQARKYGYEHTTDVNGRMKDWKKKNRYNPFCGCALFYPESAGAGLAARPEKG